MTEPKVTTIPRFKTEDMVVITDRLSSVFDSCSALWQMADDLACEAGNMESMEAFRIAVLELSRSNIRGLDACIEKLGGSCSGLFTTELNYR